MTVPQPGEQPLLSVLIVTLAHREEKFLCLLGRLLEQAEASPAPVEVVALQNNGAEALANYRDRLLREARGKYLCFVDDDDMVPGYYIEKIVEALGQDPDCVGFLEVCTGLEVQLSKLSLSVPPDTPWPPVLHEGQWQYLRHFNHAMPVRAELAKQVSFQGSSYLFTGEDMQYCSRLAPILRERGSREVFIPEIMYHYIWDANDTTQAGSRAWAYRKKWSDHIKPYVASKCFRWCE